MKSKDASMRCKCSTSKTSPAVARERATAIL